MVFQPRLQYCRGKREILILVGAMLADGDADAILCGVRKLSIAKLKVVPVELFDADNDSFCRLDPLTQLGDHQLGVGLRYCRLFPNKALIPDLARIHQDLTAVLSKIKCLEA